MVPHSIHSCSGDDEWVAVACENDEQWHSLCDLLEFPSDWRAADLAGRQVLKEDIEAAIGAWTSTREGSDVHSTLQAIGVPAHAVQDSTAIAGDPQLQHRNPFREASHGEHGSMSVSYTHLTLPTILLV